MRTVEDISIFNPVGDIDPLEGGTLLKTMRQLIDSNWSKIILDFREVSHIHYRFLSDLFALSALSSLRSGGIKLVHLNPYTQEIIKLVGAEGFFETYESLADAILSFQSRLTGSSCFLQ